MTRSKAHTTILIYLKSLDWKLLIFLLLFLNVKLFIKVIALFFIYTMRPDFKFGFRMNNSRLPVFYILVIFIGIFNWLTSTSFLNVNYTLVILTGIVFWLACILAIHQVKLSVEKNDPAIIHRTLIIFFIMNAIVSYAVFTAIAFETGTINPFRYQGDFQKYFMGTGDYIKGISFDTSTTNAVINSFGVLYFLNKKKAALTLLCMCTLLLTASNFSNILLCCIFIYLFIFASNRNQKSLIVVCIMLGVVFMAKVSPQNNKYLKEGYTRLFKKISSSNSDAVSANMGSLPNKFNSNSDEERKHKVATDFIDSMDNIMMQQRLQNSRAATKSDTSLLLAEKISIPVPNIHSASYQYKNDTTTLQKKLIDFSAHQFSALPLANNLKQAARLPGKIIGLQQTIQFFKQHPIKIITGAGMGNFSSKLSFRVTAMKIAGGYPAKYAYINPDFESNHLDLYLSYFTRQDKLHSLTNSPNSVYDQLLGEYGITGLVVLLIFYVGFFTKHRALLTYGIPILLFMAGMFFVEYWFEQLSVVILFELLLLINIKEAGITKIEPDAN